MPRFWFGLLVLSFGIASAASGVTVDWVAIGNPGNACDTQSQGCFGAVGYGYQIAKYEVTNAQYTEFLNAKAAADPLDLYNTAMTSVPYGGITRSGSSGSYTYATVAGRENWAVNYISLADAMRFTNWLNNGQGTADTETGAYTLLGATPTPSNVNTVTRNGGAVIVLPSEDEWYKAAYYDAFNVSYFDFPTGSNATTVCTAPTATANRANCDGPDIDALDPDVDHPTIVGSFTGSPSPYGTYDQGGNNLEWSDTIPVASARAVRGGWFDDDANQLRASLRTNLNPLNEFYGMGLRVVMIPEPGTGLLVLGGLLGLAVRRRA